MPPGCYLSAPKFPIGRYNADGTLDSSFGDGGLSVIVVGGGDVARAVAIQPSGKIIVAGSSTSNGMGAFALIRIHVGRPGLAAGQTTPGEDSLRNIRHRASLDGSHCRARAALSADRAGRAPASATPHPRYFIPE